MEKEQHKKNSFLLLQRNEELFWEGGKKSCKYCFNKSLRLAYSSMRCRSNVSYSCLHIHWSEVIPLLSHPKGGKAGQKILHFRQQLENCPTSTHTALRLFASESRSLCASQACSWLPSNTPRPKDARDLGQVEMRAMVGQAPIQILAASPFATVRGRLPGSAARKSDLVEHFLCSYGECKPPQGNSHWVF